MEDGMNDISGTNPISFGEMGTDFTPMGVMRASEGVAVYKLGADSQLAVEFYKRRLPIPFKSQNGVPFFDEVDYVKIMRPGDKCSVDRRAREEDKRRFPEHWYRYMNGQSQFIGTRVDILAQQGLLTDTQVEMLKYAKVNSIEQLAAASELVIQSFGTDGQSMQKIARGWLNFKAQVEGKEDINKLRKEMEASRSELQKQKDEVALQKEEIERQRTDLGATLEEVKALKAALLRASDDEPTTGKRGRPKKLAADPADSILAEFKEGDKVE